jgi:hypothetical protein
LASNYRIQARLTEAAAQPYHRDRLVKLLLDSGIPVNRVYTPLFELGSILEMARTKPDIARVSTAEQFPATGAE